MLVLSRERNELVRIVVKPSDVEQIIDVAVVELRGSKVRLGFEGDREKVLIAREEVYQPDRLPPGVKPAA